MKLKLKEISMRIYFERMDILRTGFAC